MGTQRAEAAFWSFGQLKPETTQQNKPNPCDQWQRGPAFALERLSTPHTSTTHQQKITLALIQDQIHQGCADNVDDLLRYLPQTGLSAHQKTEVRLWTAIRDNQESHPKQAKKLLSQIPKRPAFTSEFVESWLTERLSANRQLGQVSATIDALYQWSLEKPEVWQDPAFTQQFWQTLLLLPEPQLKQGSKDKTLSAWFTLAGLSKKYPADWSGLQQWRQKHAAHPAHAWLGAVTTRKPVHSIGIMLPLTGPHRDAAQTILDGILSGYYQTPIGQRPRLVIRNTAEKKCEVVYADLITEGVERIIGPLSKDELKRCAYALKRSTVPTLALNHIDETMPAHIQSLTLSPDTEIEGLVRQLRQNNRHRIVVLYTPDPLGMRLSKALEDRLSATDIQWVRHAQVTKGSELNSTLAELLGVKEQQKRHLRIQGFIKKNLNTEFDPLAEADALVVFTKADLTLQLRPHLNYHHAQSLPIYILSTALSTLDPVKLVQEKDHETLYYSHLPLMMHMSDPHIESSLKSSWPEEYERAPQFLALGADAYLQSTQGEWFQQFSGLGFPALTAWLTQDEHGIHRDLPWRNTAPADN